MKNKQPVENIIFLHLPKAGGTTLRQIFYDQYRHLTKEEIYTVNRTKETPAFVELDKTKLSEIKVLIGHFSHGIHEYLGENFTYITFLREPISRTLSQYYYSKGCNINSSPPLFCTVVPFPMKMTRQYKSERVHTNLCYTLYIGLF